MIDRDGTAGIAEHHDWLFKRKEVGVYEQFGLDMASCHHNWWCFFAKASYLYPLPNPCFASPSDQLEAVPCSQ